METLFHFLFKKRLATSLFFILPVVLGLTAFSSGFIALIFIDYFFSSDRGSMTPAIVALVNDATFYIRHEVLIFTFLGGIAGFGIAYAIHRSLGQFAAGTQQLAQGDFSARLEVENLDELGILGKDFNRMVSSLNRYFIDSMTAGWFLLDKTGKIISINPGAQAILGCPADDLIGKPLEMLSRYISRHEQLCEPILDTIQHQRANIQEIKLVTCDGRSTRVSLSTTVLKSSENTFIGVAATLKDLTRAGEITEQMQRADRLSALGTMAAGLAHEIRNPLGAIRGLTQLLHEKLGDSDRSYTQTMIKEVDRLNGVVSNLLNFARPAASEFQFCDINHLLSQSIDLLQLDIESKNVKLVKIFSSSLPQIQADGKKLVQAFLNVLMNATQAMNKGDSNAEIRVESWFDPEGRILSPDDGKGCIIVEIANSGPPIDSATAERIFDPFFTSKKEGTGLGLAITHQIVSTHQGVISFRCREGITVFTFKFPLIKSNNSTETVAP